MDIVSRNDKITVEEIARRKPPKPDEEERRARAKLAAQGIVLNEPRTPMANYVGFVRSGNLLFVSGQVGSLEDGSPELGSPDAIVTIVEWADFDPTATTRLARTGPRRTTASPRASARQTSAPSSPTLRGCDRDDGSRRGRPPARRLALAPQPPAGLPGRSLSFQASA